MRPFLFPALALAAACSVSTTDDQPQIAAREEALVNANGTWLNGTWLNGTWLNGTWLNGTWLNGTWLNGTWLNGTQLSSVHLEGSELVGTLSGSSVRGLGFRGATVDAIDGNGNKVTLRVDDVFAPPSGSDVWMYALSAHQSGGGSPVAICPVESGGALGRAIAVAGLWDSRQGVEGGGAKTATPGAITFACRGRGAIAKCVQMGYRPWASVSGQSLDHHHQACVRMLRADVCGDGTPYTVDGYMVNVYDDLGVQIPDNGNELPAGTSWALEAEWRPDGAHCVSTSAHERLLASGVTPPCLSELTSSSCGGPGAFNSGTEIMTDIAVSQP